MQFTQRAAAMAARAASRKAKITGAVAAGAVAVTLAAGGGGAIASAGAGTAVIGTAITTSYTGRTIATGVATTVVSGATIPLNGLYYTSASLTISLPAAAIVACGIFGGGGNSGSDVHVAGPYTKDSYSTIALTGYANFAAGDPLTVQCLEYAGPVSTFISGSLTAILGGATGTASGTSGTAASATSGTVSGTARAAAPGTSPAVQLARPARLLTQHSAGRR